MAHYYALAGGVPAGMSDSKVPDAQAVLERGYTNAIAGLAGAHPAWIVGSILMGAVAGGLVGDYLDDRDKGQHAATSYDALETQQTGGQSTWSNPDSGNSGSTRILNVYRTTDGKLCKDFEQTVSAGGETETANGTACQQSDGTWKPI